MSYAAPNHNYTGYGTEGALYSFTKHLDITEIAKRVRKQIKATWPDIKTSVRIERFAGGQSIGIEIKEVPFKVTTELWDQYIAAESWSTFNAWCDERDLHYSLRNRHTPEAKQLEEDLRALANQYNYDDSDGQIDYFNTNFYLHVDYSRGCEK